jgi:DNA-binding NarL/FixJ family response regulator
MSTDYKESQSGVPGSRDHTRLSVMVVGTALVRAGLAATLAPRFTVLDTDGTIRYARRVLDAYRPSLSVVVLSDAFPDGTMEDACAALISGYQGTATLALVDATDGAAVREAAKHGARGIYDTVTSTDVIRTMLLELAGGEICVQPSLVPYLVESDADGPPRGLAAAPLTPRELTTLQLLARGYTSKQITTVLQSSLKAVDLTIERAMRRLGAAHRAQAVAIATRRRLIA